MSGYEFLFVFSLAFAMAYWLQGMRAKEIARTGGRKTCDKLAVSFLDDSVVLKKIRVRRNPQGKLVLARLFHFEFAIDGDQRFNGVVLMLGMHIIDVMLDPYAVHRHDPDQND